MDRLLRFVILPLMALTVIASALYVFVLPNFYLQPVKTFGPPLRVGNRVYLLTGQWKTKLLDETARDTDLLVDLWAFDAGTARPVWRRRVEQERGGAMDGRALLGADGETLWLLLPSGIAAASLRDGSLIASPADIESRNPPLKGLLAREARYFQFDSAGLRVTAADARVWRIDARTFHARPGEGPAAAAAGTVRPAYFTPNATYLFQERGLHIPGGWLGLLNEQEKEYLGRHNNVGGLDFQSRRRLWLARVGEGRNFFGPFKTYTNFKPLGDDFLAAGLLSAYDTSRGEVLWMRNPDSVLVLHRDRLDERGRLRLSRIAGPDGRRVWDTALPLSVLQSVLPGEPSLVLYGREFTEPVDGRPRDPLHDAREKLIAIDLATGKIHAHDQDNVDVHIDAEPVRHARAW